MFRKQSATGFLGRFKSSPADKAKSLTEKTLIIKIDRIPFFVAVRENIRNAGLSGDFRFNKKQVHYWDGHTIVNNVEQLAAWLDLTSDRIVLPTENQARQILNNPNYKNELKNREINIIPFITDENDPDRNISITEFFKNSAKYRFRFLNLKDGNVETYSATLSNDSAAVLWSIN